MSSIGQLSELSAHLETFSSGTSGEWTSLKDGNDIDYKDVRISLQNEFELTSAIDNMGSCDSDCLESEHHKSFVDLIQECKDIFRVWLGEDPPADVSPMVTEFENAERPVRVRQPTSSPPQLEFLKKKIDELATAGFIYKKILPK